MTSEHPGPLVLVRHSYGGAVIGEAGNDSRVAALVYVAAFAPDQEESMASRMGARTTTLRTCHVAMLDMPFKVTDVILDAAGGH